MRCRVYSLYTTRACRVSQRGHQWCSTTVLVCDDSRARFYLDDFRPTLEADLCRNTSLVHCATVTATTTNHHHCYQQTKMPIDSNHWRSSDSIDPSFGSVDVQCVEWVDLNFPSHQQVRAIAHSAPVLQSDDSAHVLDSTNLALASDHQAKAFDSTTLVVVAEDRYQSNMPQHCSPGHLHH